MIYTYINIKHKYERVQHKNLENILIINVKDNK